jgi:hypothetical protein
MTKEDVLRKAWDRNNPHRHSYLADDFQFTDALGSPPTDKESWVAMGDLMESAVPDLEYVIEGIREEEDRLAVSTRITGTFINDFDLSAMGMGVIRATGKTVDVGPFTNLVSFDNGMIASMHDPNTGPDAGMQGFLKALGADIG